MSPAAVQLWGPRHNYKMESWKFSTGDKGPVPPPASRRWKNTRAPAEKLISPLNARLLYVGRVLELKWAPRKPASAGRGAAFYGQRPWKPKACSSLSSSPSSLVFFFILRRPRYTSGRTSSNGYASGGTVAERGGGTSPLQNSLLSFLFSFSCFKFQARIRREIFLFLDFRWKDRIYVAILKTDTIITDNWELFLDSYLRVRWFYPEEDK